MQPRKSLASLSEEEVRELAARRDVCIMQPTYDTTFAPWPETRVRACVHALCRISRAHNDAEGARSEALKSEELREFSSRYQKIFERFSDPQVSRSEENVKVILQMILLHENMRAGKLTVAQAKSQASDVALAGILRQTPGAPTPPPQAASVEELD